MKYILTIITINVVTFLFSTGYLTAQNHQENSPQHKTKQNKTIHPRNTVSPMKNPYKEMDYGKNTKSVEQKDSIITQQQPEEAATTQKTNTIPNDGHWWTIKEIDVQSTSSKVSQNELSYFLEDIKNDEDLAKSTWINKGNEWHIVMNKQVYAYDSTTKNDVLHLIAKDCNKCLERSFKILANDAEKITLSFPHDDNEDVQVILIFELKNRS